MHLYVRNLRIIDAQLIVNGFRIAYYSRFTIVRDILLFILPRRLLIWLLFHNPIIGSLQFRDAGFLRVIRNHAFKIHCSEINGIYTGEGLLQITVTNIRVSVNEK